MSGSALIAVSEPGELAVWRIVDAGQPHLASPRRRHWSLQLGVVGLGLLATAGLARAVWQHTGPDTIVQTRILADGTTGFAGRSALSEVALRFAVASNRMVTLQDGGEALVVTARDPDPAEAQQRSRSVVDAILNAPVAAGPVAMSTEPTGAEGKLHAERAQLAAAADAMEARWVALSTSLAALARDAASASRNAADHRPGRETLDKGNAALADLQLQRLQMASKYQDTYPAVIALDIQIRTLRLFLSDEARRVEGHAAVGEPVDPVLNRERDRLRAELSQVDGRRQAIAADLARVDGKIAALPPAAAAVPATILPPVLVAAATTTSLAGADDRLLIVPAVAAAGLVVSVLAWLLARRRPSQGLPPRLMLERVGPGILPPGNARAFPPVVQGAIEDGRFVGSFEQSGWQGRASPR